MTVKEAEVKTDETTEEKLAKSSGNDTEKYSKDLEEEADNMLKDMYSPKSTEDEKEEEPVKAEEEEIQEEPEEEPDEILADAEDTVEMLREKLAKSEKRVKDNQSAFHKNKQALSTQELKANTVIDTLKDTISGLQEQITQRPSSETRQEEKKADAEIKESVGDLKAQFEVLNSIDPDIAAPIKKIIESLEGKITNLNTTLANKTESDNRTAAQMAEDAHFKALDNAHSDWEEIAGSDELETWMKDLSPRQEANARRDLSDGSAEQIIGLLDEYKESLGIEKEPVPNTKNEDKIALAKGMTNPNFKKSQEIKTSPKVKYTRSMIREMNIKDPTWYAKHEADIDAEIAARRVPNI